MHELIKKIVSCSKPENVEEDIEEISTEQQGQGMGYSQYELV